MVPVLVPTSAGSDQLRTSCLFYCSSALSSSAWCQNNTLVLLWNHCSGPLKWVLYQRKQKEHSQSGSVVRGLLWIHFHTQWNAVRQREPNAAWMLQRPLRNIKTIRCLWAIKCFTIKIKNGIYAVAGHATFEKANHPTSCLHCCGGQRVLSIADTV